MGDMVKGFFLLILLLVGGVVAYVSWLILVPVSETDAQFRLANVCYGGQLLSSTLNGASHRPISCECINAGLVKAVGSAGMAKGADALRQLFAQQIWRAANGEKPGELDKTLMSDRDVLTFMAALHRLDRDCKISPFAAR
jgi:hypothetical protein